MRSTLTQLLSKAVPDANVIRYSYTKSRGDMGASLTVCFEFRGLLVMATTRKGGTTFTKLDKCEPENTAGISLTFSSDGVGFLPRVGNSLTRATESSMVSLAVQAIEYGSKILLLKSLQQQPVQQSTQQPAQPKKEDVMPSKTHSPLEVTSVQVFPVTTEGKLRAFARVVINDQLQLTSLRVYEGTKGLFVSYPNDPAHKGEDYRQLFFPLTKELRDRFEVRILGEYAKVIG